MVEVDRLGYSLKMTDAGIIPLPLDTVQSSFIQDSGRVFQAILASIEEEGIKSTDVITGAPGPVVIIPSGTSPIQDTETLEETILFEAGNFIPESLDNMNFYYSRTAMDHSPHQG